LTEAKKKTVKKKKAANKSKMTSPKEFCPVASDLKDAGRRAGKIYSILSKTYPDARIALNFGNPLEILIATILSAQCTDVRVNIVTRDLFRKYRNAGDYANAGQEELENDIRSTGFYRNKAKNIRAACSKIVEKFDSKVPDNMDDLLGLAGIGRKTANVVLGNAFGVPGITTDTHVIRLSRLMGLSANTDPVKLEFDLMELIPKKDWTQFSHVLIFHGRRICPARRPGCDDCPVREHCCFGRMTLKR